MNATFGLMNFWIQGDTVSRLIALLLLGMSIASWVIIITKSITLYKAKELVREIHHFWHAKDYQLAMSEMTVSQNPFLELAQSASQAMTHHQTNQHQLHQSITPSDWLTRCLKISIDKSVGELQHGLTYLASTGATAPFIGLFGTVWGIYHALVGIGSTGTATIDQVAGPIGEALIMTALGLGVAIPAVLGYNAINRGNKVLIAELHRFGNDLYAYFMTGSRLQPSIDQK